ncbi:tautomerase [Pseudomonas gingeri]|uniref:tautomerase n=1 Tax=Pseudomonas gingeri TaxID=117681 RepID=UPI0015A09101|nr:tautomerase [Pseudomonas gingeri]NWA25578.1 tautomerase [Pseudomonas gingeri]
MPNILVKIPKGSFLGDHRTALVKKINEAAAAAEQIPADPNKRFLCWVVIDEVDAGGWTCGGVDMMSQLIPCVAMVYVPAGVLDDEARSHYVQLMHAAFEESLPPDEKRQLATSVVLHEVADGAWGGNGAIWHLPQFAKAAGFTHLQHLLESA